MKKIAVVGPIPRDTIITHTGQEIKKYGGISNPVIALANLLGTEGEVYPITNIRKQDREPVESLFAPHASIKLNGINDEEDRGTVVYLKFLDENRRVERQTACMNPILPKHVKDFLDVDVFVFVPITDYEIPLETLKFIKNNSEAQIIFDAHGPTNCMTIHGERHLKFWVDRDLWLPYIDVLKMNIEEAQCCWFKREYELNEMDEFDYSIRTDFFDEFGRYVIEHGTTSLMITMDSRGCALYARNGENIDYEFIPSVPVENVIDTTGCGDSFAGGLGYGYLYSDDPIIAVYYANALGAQRTQGTDFTVFLPKEETKKQIEQAYSIKL